MTSNTLCIDGFNLSLAKGSGIATYARNLHEAQRDLGYSTNILYGPAQGGGGSNLLSEIALYDAAPAKPRTRAQEGTDEFLSILGRKARKITPTGEVLPDRGAPQPDAFWTARDLFHRANRAFAGWRRFTPVELAGSAAPDLMHWTCALPLEARRMANVYTVHDLVPLRLPQATLDNKRHFHAMCQRICRTADHVITVSESARADLIRVFGIEEARVTNTYQAVSVPAALTSVPDAEVAAEVESTFGLDWKRYFLFFGAIEPKKNLARVIEAYLSSGAADPLIIIGGQAWLDDAQTRLLYEDLVAKSALENRSIRRADRVRRYDYMPYSTLVSLVRGAKATLFPSLYEGFGLPVLESMLLGTPVLTSGMGALPEVAGEAALIVDPLDVRAIRRGIAALDRDADLREGLVARGREQAAAFSPERYRSRVGDLYRTLL